MNISVTEKHKAFENAKKGDILVAVVISNDERQNSVGEILHYLIVFNAPQGHYTLVSLTKDNVISTMTAKSPALLVQRAIETWEQLEFTEIIKSHEITLVRK